MKLGLGIDTGGTYTDAVIYDFESKNILSSAKSITVKEDLTVGINNTLNKLPDGYFGDVSLVSLSTTLATNACVEGKGSRAVLVMIGCDKNVILQYGSRYGLPGLDKFIFVDGGHTQHGEAGTEPDWDLLKSEINRISGFTDSYGVVELWGIHNNQYELKAKNLIRQWTGAPVVCAHELTNELNSLKRAASTLLNAQLIFLINEFLNAVKVSLNSLNIQAPLVIVRGDGSLMSEDFARERPVETLLSGPAASVAGGTALSGESDCIIVDMGGTTSDIAVVKNDLPSLAHNGVRVGSWTTGTSSILISTIGLGGDSRITYNSENQVVIGPARTAPLSWLASRWPQVLESLAHMTETKKRHTRSLCEFFYLLKNITDDKYFTREERQIVNALKNGPLSISALCDAADTSIYSVKTERLEKHGIIMRSTLTPTDIMHLTGQFSGWDLKAASFGAEMIAFNLNITVDELIAEVNRLMKEKLYLNIVKFMLEYNKVLPGSTPQTDELILAGFRNSPDMSLSFRTGLPLVGIGAPIHLYLPDVAKALGTSCVVPRFASVANAMGAITGNVSAEAMVTIEPIYGDIGIIGYTVYTPESPARFGDYTCALEWARSEATRLAREKAILRGAGNVNVLIEENRNEAILAGYFLSKANSSDTQPDSADGNAEPAADGNPEPAADGNTQPAINDNAEPAVNDNKIIVETIIKARAVGSLKL